MATPVPTKIGKYEVTGVIGRGGMGVVYQANDPHLDRPVAIKMITLDFAENPDMLKRFFREAQSLGSLQHPNIVTVFDLGDYGGNPYLVMEYLQGERLDSVFANQRSLSLLEKITIVIEVCHGLSHAHRRGVVHRDIKPANIMIGKDGSIKIFDFGIAYVGHQQVTRTGQIVGTLSYMAPEQVNGRAIDFRTDIFSTGVMLYQLFTNHLPFDGGTTESTLLKIMHDPPPPLSNFLSTYYPEMERILARALAKDPSGRYGSAEEFALDLAQLQGQLKDQLVEWEMKETAVFLDQGDVYKAQSSLLRVLKVDQQNTNANRLLREVRQRIQQEELGKQVLELRRFAEEAISNRLFTDALQHVDRALGMDRNNDDLQQLRDTICAAILSAEKLQEALKMAEEAQAEGKLEEAKVAAEAALTLAPDDTQAKTLYRIISREIEEHYRQLQMEGYLSTARQDISSRRFTQALEVLRKAEMLESSAPGVHALIEMAAAGQEQERRSRELEALTKEVSGAMDTDDYGTAFRKAEEGLARFPGDRNLLKLKELADRQRRVEEQKRYVEGQLAIARDLLQAGRLDEVQRLLEESISKAGAEPRLQSLLEIVGEKRHRLRIERQKAETTRNAEYALQNGAFISAIQMLEGLEKTLSNDLEVRQLLARARSEKEEAVQSFLKTAAQEPVLETRLKTLEAGLVKFPDENRIKEQVQYVANLDQVISKICDKARALEESGQYEAALAKWGTVRTAYPQHPDLKSSIQRLRDLRDRAQTDTRQNWIDGIEKALAESDYAKALALFGQANEEFPWDSDLMELQQRAETGLRQRGKAEKMFAEGRKSLANQQWDAGSQLMMRAYQAADQDVVIRNQIVDELETASRAAMEKNWQASELLLSRLGEIEPSLKNAPDLQVAIQQRKREQVIGSVLEIARKKQSSNDLVGALREIGLALESYPEDFQLQDFEALLKRQQAARSEMKANYLKRLQLSVSSGEYPQAEELLAVAKSELPGDSELARIEVALRAGMARRAQADRSLGAAAKAIERGKWLKASELFGEAMEAGQSDLVIREQVLRGLLSAAEAALSASDFESSERLLGDAAQVEPGSPLLPAVRESIEASKRRLTEECLAALKRCASSQDWQGALRSLERGLAVQPQEPQLLEKREWIEGEIAKGEASTRLKSEQQVRQELEESGREASVLIEPAPVSQSATQILDAGVLKEMERDAARVPSPPPPRVEVGESRGMSKARHDEATPVVPVLLDAAPKDSMPNPAEDSAVKRGPAAAEFGLPIKTDRMAVAYESSTAEVLEEVGVAELNQAELHEALLQSVERRLATYVGPLAKVLVKRAASKTRSLQELYRMLASNLDNEQDRKAFLAKGAELRDERAGYPASKGTTVEVPRTIVAPLEVRSSSEITPADIDEAVGRLAPILGPIALIVARKEAKRATTLMNFYELLSEHISEPSDRNRFLKQTQPLCRGGRRGSTCHPCAATAAP